VGATVVIAAVNGDIAEPVLNIAEMGARQDLADRPWVILLLHLPTAEDLLLQHGTALSMVRRDLASLDLAEPTVNLCPDLVSLP